MSLSCKVMIANRVLPILNIKDSRKTSLATLGIVKYPKDSCVYLVIVTVSKKDGSRYKILNNIAKTFGILEDGKSTIRFRNPPHDVFISAEKKKLRDFMLMLRNICTGSDIASIAGIRTTDPLPPVPPPSPRFTINKRSDYPITEGFPNHLTCLSVIDCGLKNWDHRFDRLVNLTFLCLSRNKLTTLPVELGDLKLVTLILNDNNLTCNSMHWRFIPGDIADTLNKLDISNNQLSTLPSRFRYLTVLKHLNVSGNMIEHLPGGCWPNVPQLINLDLSKNRPSCRAICPPAAPSDMPSLTCIVANYIVDARFPYSEAIIPEQLVTTLDEARYCYCGKATVECHGVIKGIALSNTIASTFYSSSGCGMIPIYYCACSKWCYQNKESANATVRVLFEREDFD